MIRSRALKGSKRIKSKSKRYLIGSIIRPSKSNRGDKSSLIDTRKIIRQSSVKIGINQWRLVALRHLKRVTTRIRKILRTTRRVWSNSLIKR